MAQKRIPVLEDFSWQLPVLAIANTPSVTTFGSRYIVGTSPTGSFSGQANKVAWVDGAAAWFFDTPLTGWTVHNVSTGHDYRFDGTDWHLITNKTITVRPIATASDDLHPTELAVRKAIDELMGLTDAMIFIGTIGTGGIISAPNFPDVNGTYFGTGAAGTKITDYSAGWTFKVIAPLTAAFTGFDLDVEIGDMVIAIGDEDGGFDIADFTAVQTNIDLTAIDHLEILNIGTYTHQGIDAHIETGNIHRQMDYSSALKSIIWNDAAVLPSAAGDTNE